MNDEPEYPHDVERRLREDDSGDYRRELLTRLERMRIGLLKRQRDLATARDFHEIRTALVAVEFSIRAAQLVKVGRGERTENRFEGIVK